MVHLDSRFALFVPVRAARERGLEPFRMLRAGTDPRYLFAVGDGDMGRAREEVGRVLAGGDGETLGLLLRGVLGLRAAGAGPEPERAAAPSLDVGACAAAVVDLERLVGARPDVPMFAYFLAVARACTGDCGRALEEASSLVGRFPDAGRLAEAVSRGCVPRDGRPPAVGGVDPGGDGRAPAGGGGRTRWRRSVIEVRSWRRWTRTHSVR